MLKKLFFTAAVAAAVAVPLAGVASADAGDPNGNGLGKGGMPQRLGDFAATGVTPPLAPSNDKIPPGQEFNTAKDYYAAVHPGQKANTPLPLRSSNPLFGQAALSQTEPLFRTIRTIGRTSLRA
jgi:hypothetical protein